MEIKNNPFFGKMMVNLALAGAVTAMAVLASGCTVQNYSGYGGGHYYKPRAAKTFGKACSGGGCGNDAKRYQIRR